MGSNDLEKNLLSHSSPPSTKHMIHVDLQVQVDSEASSLLLSLYHHWQWPIPANYHSTVTWSMDEEAGDGITTKTGPNDTRSVNGALGEFFSSFSLYNLAY